MSPVNRINDIYFIHRQHRDIILVACTKEDVFLAQLFEDLEHLVLILENVLGICRETSIRSQLLTVFEILHDERMQIGNPWFGHDDEDDSMINKQWSTTGHSIPETRKFSPFLSIGNKKFIVSTKRKGRKKTPFILMNFCERLHYTWTAGGNVLKNAKIEGHIEISWKSANDDAFECQWSLEKESSIDRRPERIPITFPNEQFDECEFSPLIQHIQTNTGEMVSTIRLINEGSMSVMRYIITNPILEPFKMHVAYHESEDGHSHYEMQIKAIGTFPLPIDNLRVTLPMPDDAQLISSKSNFGKVKQNLKQHLIFWK